MIVPWRQALSMKADMQSRRDALARTRRMGVRGRALDLYAIAYNRLVKGHLPRPAQPTKLANMSPADRAGFCFH
jgi:hypothetical protein